MPVTALYTSATDFRRVLATNSTASAYTAKADTVTAPTAVAVDSAGGYIDLKAGQLPDYCPNAVVLKFYGAGADNATGNCRVYGVRAVRDATGVLNYTHNLLADFAFILSAAVGVASGVVPAAQRYADTITRTAGLDLWGDQLLSPTGDVAGFVRVNCRGFSTLLIEPIVGTATSVNVLWAGE